MSRLPALFLSHGAPTVLIDGSTAPAAWRDWAATHPKPRAIVVLSAHRPASGASVGIADAYRAWHDFSGFPAELYRLQYDVAGQPELARDILARLAAAGIDAGPDTNARLDHGAWVALMAMYPAADVPVVPLAVMPHQDARAHYALGRALAALADDGVLLVGSGSLTHNLYEVSWNDPATPAWVSGFRDWMLDKLAANDVDALLDWQTRAPFARENHPTDEHLLPLFFALGAGGGGAATAFNAGVAHRTVAMDALAFGE